MDSQSPVYNAKHKRPVVIRILENLLAVILTIVLWIFIIITLYNKLYVDASPALYHAFVVMALICIAAIALLVIWQFYNWFRFHNKHRRKEFPAQSLEDVGRLYGIAPHNMERLQQIRNVAVVEFRNHRYYYCIDGQEPIEIGMLRKK